MFLFLFFGLWIAFCIIFIIVTWKKKQLQNLVKFYKLKNMNHVQRNWHATIIWKSKKTNGEGTIALSQMSSIFQLPLKKSGHHFCFFYRLLPFSSMDLHNFNLKFGVHPSLQVEPSNSRCFHQRFKTHFMKLFYLVCFLFCLKGFYFKMKFFITSIWN